MLDPRIIIPERRIYSPGIILPKEAAVSIVTIGTARVSNTNAGTASYTLVAGPNLCAFAPMAYDAADGMRITSCSIGGVNLISAGTISHNTTTHLYSECWYLVNPPLGANIFKVNVSGTLTEVFFNIITFANVNRTFPVRPGSYIGDVGNLLTDGSGNYTKNITSTVGDLTLSVVNGGPGNNVTATQTRDAVITAAVNSYAHDHGTGAGTVVHTWSGAGAGTPISFVGLSIAAQPNKSVIQNINQTRKRSWLF